MQPEDWEAGFGRTIGMFLNGEGIRGVDVQGRRIVDKHFLVYFNAHTEAVEITLPDRGALAGVGCRGRHRRRARAPFEPGAAFSLRAPHSLAVLREQIAPSPPTGCS